MLDIVIKPYYALPCKAVFTINGINADIDDFGNNDDIDKEHAPAYGCGNHRFTPDYKKAVKAIKKYNISSEDFYNICGLLTVELDVGECGWCI